MERLRPRFQAKIKIIAVFIAASVICLSAVYLLLMAEGTPLQNNTTLSSPTLVSPINKVVVQSTPELVWSRVSGASAYELEIVSEKTVKIVCARKGLPPSITKYQLQANEALSLGIHHWRVRAVNAAGKAGAWSDSGRFTVQ